MATSRHFLVVLSGDFSQRLEMPPKFVQHMEKTLGKLNEGPMPVKIAGSTGITWDVVIEGTAGRTHFTCGWSKFARDNMLKENEFLVFRYDGTKQFYAAICGETMCERNIIHKVAAKRAPKAVPSSDSEWNESSDRDEASDEEDEEEEDDRDDYANNSTENEPKKRGVSSSTPGLTHSSSSRKKMQGHYVSQRRPVTNLEKQNAAEAAFAFTSKKPYCMIRMTANMVYHWSSLRFPMRFSKNYLPREKTQFILKNSAGKEWMGSYILETYNYSKGMISRGWTNFARDNNLEEDDYCVFELVHKNVFHIHIFRVVNQVVRPVWVKNK